MKGSPLVLLFVGLFLIWLVFTDRAYAVWLAILDPTGATGKAK
jgi:hypothetical protein